MMENTDRSISIIRKIGKYLLHGFMLGIPTFVLMIAGYMIPFIAYSAIILLGLTLVNAVYYGFVFMIMGGMNQVLAERLWEIESQQNIGSGMRDGFVVYVIFNIVGSPMILVFFPVILTGWTPVIPLVAYILLLIITPIYLVLLGVIGEKIARFLHVDMEPKIAIDLRERIYICPHCGSSYYYGPEKVHEGRVECQNCAKLFPIS
jgi:hypothetical protein